MNGVQVRLVQIGDALDVAGEARAALVLPPQAGSASKKPVVKVFGSLAEAISAKRLLELEAVHASPA